MTRKQIIEAQVAELKAEIQSISEKAMRNQTEREAIISVGDEVKNKCDDFLRAQYLNNPTGKTLQTLRELRECYRDHCTYGTPLYNLRFSN